MQTDEQFSALLSNTGVSYLKPYQELIIRHILENEEEGKKTRLLAVLPTGSGKTLCFMLPILFLGGISICVYPLLSLLGDQERRFDNMGIKNVIIKGGMTKAERREKISSLSNGGAILVSMEMLEFMVENNELKEIKNNLKFIIVDEVHTAITWGDSFRPSYQKLGKIIQYLSPPHTLLFTATIDKNVGNEIIKKIFLNKTPYIVRASSDRENIFYHSVRSINKKMDCIKILRSPSSRPAVIFSSSREKCEEYSSFLSSFFETKYYHAGMEKDERDKVEKWFFSSTSGVLCATNAYGMGVDKENIRTIIHLTLPSSSLSFLQESGRGGRDGCLCDSYVLYNNEKETPLSYIFKGKKCIRTSLLREMNESVESEGCSGCSSCVEDFYISAGEREILCVLSFFLFIKKKSLFEKLTSFSLLFIKYRLRGWKYNDYFLSLSILEDDGYITSCKELIKITKKGRERVKELKKKYKLLKKSKLR